MWFNGTVKEDQTYIKNMFGLFLYFSERKENPVFEQSYFVPVKKKLVKRVVKIRLSNCKRELLKIQEAPLTSFIEALLLMLALSLQLSHPRALTRLISEVTRS